MKKRNKKNKIKFIDILIITIDFIFYNYLFIDIVNKFLK